MNISLENKKAIVCGSTQGIGKAIAMELAGLGAEVTLIARSEDALFETIKQLPKLAGQNHSFISADFSNPDILKIKMEDFIKKENIIDILVNNTGGPAPGPITEAKPEEFLKAFSAHLICNHILTQAVLPGMKKKGSGRIINIISTSVKQPLNGLGVSNTIRGSVASWSKTLANEVAQFGITVNNILPGATNTVRLQSIIENKAVKYNKTKEEVLKEMENEVPMKRIGNPEEIAAAAAFLASPAASYITGVSLAVDGGRTVCL